MGAGSSKPEPSDSQHIFTSETPIRFSQPLIDSLQTSPESDSTRSASHELAIQRRVTAELSRLEASTTKSLQELSEQISALPDRTTESSQTLAQPNTPDQSNSAGGVDHKAKEEGDRLRELSRESVQREIERLKAKLKERQVKEDVVGDEGVRGAREEVVRCLRGNDRRPLDCWKEVEAFRREVGRLEARFLGKVLE